jgi:hypothetical protein
MDGRYGSCNDGPTKDMKWINNGTINKCIPKNDLVPDGWELRKVSEIITMKV